MAHFKFIEHSNSGVSNYESHSGEIDFELIEVLLNDNSFIEDMIVYLFIDAFRNEWDVDSAFKKLEELDYETEWFEEKLKEKGITFEYDEGNNE